MGFSLAALISNFITAPFYASLVDIGEDEPGTSRRQQLCHAAAEISRRTRYNYYLARQIAHIHILPYVLFSSSCRRADDQRPNEAGQSTGTRPANAILRSEEHTSELQSLMRISYAVFCLKKKTLTKPTLMYDQDRN